MLAGASTKILGINHSSTLTEALHAEDDSASRNLRQSDARALELVKPIAMNNAPSPNINALDTEAAVDIELTHTLKLTALPPETTPSRVAYDSRLSVPVSLPDEKKAHFSHPVLYHFLISFFFLLQKKKKRNCKLYLALWNGIIFYTRDRILKRLQRQWNSWRICLSLMAWLPQDWRIKVIYNASNYMQMKLILWMGFIFSYR